MYAIVEPQSKTINHPDKRTASGVRRETMKWWRVIDADTGSELRPAHWNQAQTVEWASGFNAALKIAGIASPFIGTWEWESQQGVTHVVEASGYCLTCGRTHTKK